MMHRSPITISLIIHDFYCTEKIFFDNEFKCVWGAYIWEKYAFILEFLHMSLKEKCVISVSLASPKGVVVQKRQILIKAVAEAVFHLVDVLK